MTVMQPIRHQAFSPVIRTLLAVTVWATVSGCQLLKPGDETTNRGPADDDAVVAELESRQFAHEINRLEKEVVDSPADVDDPNAHLQLAFLYMNSANPRRNYPIALHHLDAYLLLSEDAADRPTLKSMRSLLKALSILERRHAMCEQDKKQLQQQSDDLMGRQRLLEEQLRQSRTRSDRLANENARLRRTLETLQAIDRKLEEKRKSYR